MYEVAATIDIGLVREKNDDRILLGQEIFSHGFRSFSRPSGKLLAAVADGMGGNEGGGQAAELALQAIADVVADTFSEEKILEGLAKANASVGELQVSSPALSRAGTTLAGILLDGADYFVFHLGDSRVYRYRAGMMKKLTKDHSEAQLVADVEGLTLEELRLHPRGHLLFQYVGTREINPEVSFYQGFFLVGDILLICSDGLSDMAPWEAIEGELGRGLHLVEVCQNLVELAKAGGGNDNIGVVLIKKLEGE